MHRLTLSAVILAGLQCSLYAQQNNWVSETNQGQSHNGFYRCPYGHLHCYPQPATTLQHTGAINGQYYFGVGTPSIQPPLATATPQANGVLAPLVVDQQPSHQQHIIRSESLGETILETVQSPSVESPSGLKETVAKTPLRLEQSQQRLAAQEKARKKIGQNPIETRSNDHAEAMAKKTAQRPWRPQRDSVEGTPAGIVDNAIEEAQSVLRRDVNLAEPTPIAQETPSDWVVDAAKSADQIAQHVDPPLPPTEFPELLDSEALEIEADDAANEFAFDGREDRQSEPDTRVLPMPPTDVLSRKDVVANERAAEPAIKMPAVETKEAAVENQLPEVQLAEDTRMAEQDFAEHQFVEGDWESADWESADWDFADWDFADWDFAEKISVERESADQPEPIQQEFVERFAGQQSNGLESSQQGSGSRVIAEPEFVKESNAKTPLATAPIGIRNISNSRRSMVAAKRASGRSWWWLPSMLLAPCFIWGLSRIRWKGGKREQQESDQRSNVATLAPKATESIKNDYEVTNATNASTCKVVGSGKTLPVEKSVSATNARTNIRAATESPEPNQPIVQTPASRIDRSIERSHSETTASVFPIVGQNVKATDDAKAAIVETNATDVPNTEVVSCKTTKTDVAASDALASDTVRSGVVSSHVERTETASQDVLLRAEGSTEIVRDDFTALDGIDAQTQDWLYSAGYQRFSDLESVEPSQLKQQLAAWDPKFEQQDLSGWMQQASVASQRGSRTERLSLSIADELQDSRPERADVNSNSKSPGNSKASDQETRFVSERKLDQDMDDFTQIDGIDEKTQRALYRAGYRRFADLESADTEQLTQALERQDIKVDTSKYASWIRFASQRTRNQASPQSHTQNASVQNRSESQQSNPQRSETRGTHQIAGFRSVHPIDAEDLTRINGIGPTTARLLRASGIHTFGQLAAANENTLHQILASGGPRCNLIDPQSWSEQARFAIDRNWAGLDEFNEKRKRLHQAQETGQHNDSSRQVSSDQGRDGDDLKEIKGIGPAVEKILRSQGIVRLEQIATMDKQQIAALFAPKFGLVNPETWPSQAIDLLSRDDATSAEMDLLNQSRKLADLAAEADRKTQKQPERSEQV